MYKGCFNISDIPSAHVGLSRVRSRKLVDPEKECIAERESYSEVMNVGSGLKGAGTIYITKPVAKKRLD